MYRGLNRYIQKLRTQKKQRRRILAFTAAMSLVVTCSVSWQLHGIGTAMNDDDLQVAIEDGVVQLSNDESLFETPTVWESTLPDLSEDLTLPERLVMLSESQLGYKENMLNYAGTKFKWKKIWEF